MSKAPTVTVQIGSRYRKFAVDNPDVLAHINKEIATSIQRNAITRIYADAIPRIQKAVNAASEREVAKFMPFIAKNLIGIETPRQRGPIQIDLGILDTQGRKAAVSPFEAGTPPGALTSPPRVVWEALSLSWVRRKTKNHNKFFLHTGALRAQFQNDRIAKKTLEQLGGTVVQFKTKEDAPVKNLLDTDVARASAKSPGRKAGGIVRILDINIQYAKGLTAYNTPALSADGGAPNDALARKLGFSASSLKKLQGHIMRHRPLLQPAVAYWFFFKMPRVIRTAYNNAVQEAVRDRRGL